jgi:hypothetical protein
VEPGRQSVSVAAHWEQSWNVPLSEATLWAWPLRDFGVSDWRMWPVSGIRCPEQRVELREYESMRELLPALPADREVVFIEPADQNFPVEDRVLLPDFDHPENAAYIFGSNHFNPTVAHRTNEPVVTIPTVENSGVIWSHQCLVTVLYDRLVKA